ncbi:hypothetical protein H4R33_002741 [Dimargaris cristalligena]|nr:hypothetical protein H4R33_002741 [Dimargaris cristalligena]
MSTNSTTQILAFPNASESETRQQRRTFWVRLNRYARNTDILALASTNRAHANALRPHCFRHVRISTGVDSTHGAFRTIVNHQAAIEHLTLVLADWYVWDNLFGGFLGMILNCLGNLQCLTLEIHHPELLNWVGKLLQSTVQVVKQLRIVSPANSPFKMELPSCLVPFGGPFLNGPNRIQKITIGRGVVCDTFNWEFFMRLFPQLQCLVLQDVDLHYPLKFIQAVSLGGLEQLVMKNVFAYSSVVSPTTPSHSTPRTSMHLTSLVLNGVGLGDTVLKSIVDLLGSGLCILRLINCICNQWEVSYALTWCARLTHFELSHRDEVFTRDLFPSEFASKNILFLRLVFNFVAIAWFQPALCKLQQLRQLSLYKPTCPQLQRIRRALPQLAIHFITTEEFNNLVNREYVERVADR